jgi:phage host-nuclease inhibitor protein Gam
MDRNGINYILNIDSYYYELHNSLMRDKHKILKFDNLEKIKQYINEIKYLNNDIEVLSNNLELYCRALKDKLENG